jgi:hypothetical protein
VDKAIAEYITAGSLGSDAGRHILALFICGEELRQPRAVKAIDLLSALHIDTAIHPAYQMVMWLFPEGKRPVLPGLVVFGGSLSSNEIVFVSLAAEQDMQGVAALCRKVFVTVENCWSKGPESLSDCICADLRHDSISYERQRGMSVREWLVASFQFVKEHKESIASTVFDIAKTAL